jgi:hypothetical protein
MRASLSTNNRPGDREKIRERATSNYLIDLRKVALLGWRTAFIRQRRYAPSPN